MKLMEKIKESIMSAKMDPNTDAQFVNPKNKETSNVSCQ